MPVERVMDSFVPALASNPCADKAHCAGKAGRLAKQGNAGSARIRSQPGGKPPLGAHDCVGSALKPLRILRPCRLVLHAQRGFRGDERAHDTLSHFPTTGLRPPVRKCSRLPRNRRRRLPLRTALHRFAHCDSEQEGQPTRQTIGIMRFTPPAQVRRTQTSPARDRGSSPRPGKDHGAS